MVLTSPLGAAEVPAWAKVTPEQVAAAKEIGVPVAFENAAGMRFVLIPPGKFTMGSHDSAAEVARKCEMPNAQAGWFYDEQPPHEVTLTAAFYMATTEVSHKCYNAVINPNPEPDAANPRMDNYEPDFKADNQPAGKISWRDAEKFCQMLGELERREAEKAKQEGGEAEGGEPESSEPQGPQRKYTLPTEAQWEYAARAGTTTPFSFGESVSPAQANYHGGYTYAGGPKGVNREKTVPVGSLPANAWGLREMHGNMSEWTADRYAAYTAEAQTDPTGPEEGNQRVLRGGSWRSYPGACRSSFRLSSDEGANSINIGLRVCCVLIFPTESETAE